MVDDPAGCGCSAPARVTSTASGSPSTEAFAADAVRDVDVITTCTADKRNALVPHAEEVPAGAHINAIGGDCPGKTELDVEIVRRSRVSVEHTPQTRIEGEIQLLPAGLPVTQLWRVIAGADAGRVSADEVTVFDSVGFAIEDVTALRYVQAAPSRRSATCRRRPPRLASSSPSTSSPSPTTRRTSTA